MPSALSTSFKNQFENDTDSIINYQSSIAKTKDLKWEIKKQLHVLAY